MVGGSGPFTLLIAVDDATGQVVSALFCEHEDARSYFLLTRALVEHRGVPVALYTDRHAVFKHTPGPGLPAGPTQFSRAMDELGTQMIFAQSPQAKGRVERTGGTFQDRLVAELRLAGATTLEQAQAVLDEFVPRFNRRFGVPPPCSEPAFRPLDPELCLEQVLCFKRRRKVDRDNTVRFQLRTLQLLPAPERPSYAGATVEVLEGLDGQLKVRHEGRSIAAQEAPPSPVSLRNGHQPPAVSPVAPIGVNHWDERWTAHLAPLVSSQEPEADNRTSPRERWKAVQKARRKGMSLRAIERELGIHRSTVRSYLEAGGPPGWKQRMVPNPSTSDTMAA